MIREAIGIGETDEAAKADALKQLGVTNSDNITFEIIKKAEKKKFGLFGGSNAKIKAILDITDSEISDEEIEIFEETEDTPEPIEDVVLKSDTETQNIADEEIVEAVASDISEKEIKLNNYNPAQETKAYVERVLAAMGLPDIEVEITEGDNSAEINLSGDEVGAVIGRRGETLDALQYLAGLVANHTGNTYYRITINTGNYREKREKTLEILGRKLAFKVLKTGKNVSLEPMNPYERRIIHTAVQKVNGAISWSEGEVTNRHIVIGPDPEYKRPYRKSYNNGKNGNKKNYNGYDKKRSYNNDRKHSNTNGNAQTEREPKNEGGSYSLYGRVDTKNNQ